MINVLDAFGGFKAVLSKEEKQFFLESLEEYRDERIPLSAVLRVLRAWAIKHDNAYLLTQTLWSRIRLNWWKLATPAKDAHYEY